MTWADDVTVIGRQPVNVVELTLDRCSNSYGLAPCTATIALRNMVSRSEEIDDADWAKLNLTINVNDILAPDGTTTADKLEENNVNGQHQISQTEAFVSGVQYCWSVHIKPDERRVCQILLFSAAGVWPDTPGVHFDFDNLAFTAVNDLSNIIDAYGAYPVANGFFRIWITATAQATGNGGPHIQLINGGVASYQGVVGEGFHTWGLQLREGATPGKYQATAAAAIDGGGVIDDLCFNTFATCQDTPNYVATTKVVTFIDAIAQPVGVEGFPVIKRIQYAGTKINPGRGLGARAKVVITLSDFPYNDVAQDDYAVERTFNPETRGTFFGKLKERNLYYAGRKIVLKEAYIDTNGVLAFSQNREYIIDEITGPDAKGLVRIVAKDPLKLASDEKAQAPVPALSTWKQNGALASSGNATADTTAIAQAIWDAADASGSTGVRHIRIEDEIMTLGARPTTTTIAVTRGAGGTTASTHDDDSTIQPCLSYTGEEIHLVVQELLESFGNVPASFITIGDWETEKDDHLTNYNLDTIISEPTGVSKLLREISQLGLIDLWWDDLNQQIRFKVQSPYQETPLPVITDTNNIIMNSLQVKDKPASRLSRVLIWYGIKNFATDLQDQTNFRRASFEIEADKEGANKYNQIQTLAFFNRWQTAGATAQVELTSNRLVSRYGNIPIEASFKIDAADILNINTGDVFDLITRQKQTADGGDATTRMQVLEMRPLLGGTLYFVKAFAFFTDPVTEGPLTISGNRTDLDLFVELNGPSGPIIKTVIIDTGVTIDATNGIPAITMGALPAGSDITLEVRGSVYGFGGNGGPGGFANWDSEFEPEPPGFCVVLSSSGPGNTGQKGGAAIFCNPSNNITLRVIVTSTGEVFGGGGGGGGGKGKTPTGTTGDNSGGSGGGGAQGTDTPNGGVGGVGTVDNSACGAVQNRGNGNVGGVGSTGGVGTGGAAITGGRAGGDGGVWATAGDAAPIEGGNGGGPGEAIDYNGSTQDEDFQGGSDVRGTTN